MKAINYIMCIAFGILGLLSFIVAAVHRCIPIALLGIIFEILAVVVWQDYKEERDAD